MDKTILGQNLNNLKKVLNITDPNYQFKKTKLII